MAIRTILVLSALAAAAHAHPPEDSASAGDPARLIELPFSPHLELDLRSWPETPLRTASDVYTSDYRARILEERTGWESRYGVHPVDLADLRPYMVHQTPVPGSPQLHIVQELRWFGGRPLAGLQYERKDVLFHGDRLSIRSTSDVQMLTRGMGLLGSGTGADVMSLMGWRSHSRLEWQLGEPTRELQWRFTARMDRRAAVQSSAVDLQIMRRLW